MSARTRPTDYPRVFCVLCGWPGVRPGHNRKERQMLREGRLRDTIAALFLPPR